MKEEKEYRIKAYAANKNGDGRVQLIGTYDTIEDIEIICGMFADDVVISFEYEIVKENKYV